MNLQNAIRNLAVAAAICVGLLSVSNLATAQVITFDRDRVSTKSFVMAMGNGDSFIKEESHSSFTNPAAAIGTDSPTVRVCLELVNGYSKEFQDGDIVRIRYRAKYRYMKASNNPYTGYAVFFEPHERLPHWRDMEWRVRKLRRDGDNDRVIRETSLVTLQNVGTEDHLCTQTRAAATWLMTKNDPDFGLAWKFRSLY